MSRTRASCHLIHELATFNRETATLIRGTAAVTRGTAAVTRGTAVSVYEIQPAKM